ncbi:MAP/microtubule affinity-regulating kinase 3 [Gonapodya sp. JEL0774]|nr:MAP/microtubule affinity-regulating kinase 3 [Gonapodya sp. JEL0774]
MFNHHQREVTCTCLHPDPGTIATAELGVAPVIHVWSVELSQEAGSSGNSLAQLNSTLTPSIPVAAAAIPENGRTKRLSTLALPENLDGVTAMIFTKDGNWLIVAGFSVDVDVTPIYVFDWRRSEKAPVMVQGHNDRIFSVICNPFNRREFVTVGVRHIKFWKIETGIMSDKSLVVGEDGHTGKGVTQTFFSGCFTKQKILVTGSAIGDVVFWKNGSKIADVTSAHKVGPIYSIVPLDNPGGFVTGGQDGRIIVWSDPSALNGPTQMSEIKFEGSGGIRSLDVGALGGIWWGWGDNFSRRASKVITNMAVAKRKSIDVTGLASPLGFPALTAGQRASEADVGTHSPQPSSPVSVDGSRPGTPAPGAPLTVRNAILVGCGDSTIWEVQGFRDDSKVLVMEAHSTMRGAEVWGCAVHPVDSDRFATAGDDGWVKVWTVSGKGVMHRRNLGIKLRSCAWHPAGKSLAIGTDDGSFLVLTENLDVAVTPIKNRLATIHVLSYSPDGRFLAVGCHDNFLDVYAVEGENGWYQRVTCCRGHWSFVSQVDWSQDSSKLRSNSGDNEVLFWVVTLGEVMDTDAALFRDVKWAKSTCPIQWGTKGVYGGKIGSTGERDVRLNYCDSVSVLPPPDRDLIMNSSEARVVADLQQPPPQSSPTMAMDVPVTHSSLGTSDGIPAETPIGAAAEAAAVSNPAVKEAPKDKDGATSDDAKSGGGTGESQQLILGRYAPQKVLGQGSYAKVKLAIDIETKQKVAVKLFDKTQITKPSQVKRLKREVRLLKLLNHPHIIKLYEVGETEDRVILIMEYVAGGELFDYIVAAEKVPEKTARKLFRQMVSALEYCHRSQIIHRDLKPENVLLDSEGNVKIADFGFVSLFDKYNRLETHCGSPYYSSPEVVLGKKYIGPELDIWSLGVCLYALLSSRVPFHGKELKETQDKITRGKYETPAYFSATAKDLVRRMLEVDPTRRISIADVAKHPWVCEGHSGPPESLLPERPAVAEVVPEVIGKMAAFGFKDSIAAEAKIKKAPNSAEFALYYLIREQMMRSGKLKLKQEDKPASEVAQSARMPNQDSSTLTRRRANSQPPSPLRTAELAAAGGALFEVPTSADDDDVIAKDDDAESAESRKSNQGLGSNGPGSSLTMPLPNRRRARSMGVTESSKETRVTTASEKAGSMGSSTVPRSMGTQPLPASLPGEDAEASSQSSEDMTKKTKPWYKRISWSAKKKKAVGSGIVDGGGLQKQDSTADSRSATTDSRSVASDSRSAGTLPDSEDTTTTRNPAASSSRALPIPRDAQVSMHLSLQRPSRPSGNAPRPKSLLEAQMPSTAFNQAPAPAGLAQPTELLNAYSTTISTYESRDEMASGYWTPSEASNAQAADPKTLTQRLLSVSTMPRRRKSSGAGSTHANVYNSSAFGLPAGAEGRAGKEEQEESSSTLPPLPMSSTLGRAHSRQRSTSNPVSYARDTDILMPIHKQTPGTALVVEPKKSSHLSQSLRKALKSLGVGWTNGVPMPGPEAENCYRLVCRRDPEGDEGVLEFESEMYQIQETGQVGLLLRRINGDFVEYQDLCRELVEQMASLYARVSSVFTRALTGGDLVFTESTIRYFDDSGLKFQIRFAPALAKKPTLPSIDRSEDKRSRVANPFFPPDPNLLSEDLIVLWECLDALDDNGKNKFMAFYNEGVNSGARYSVHQMIPVDKNDPSSLPIEELIQHHVQTSGGDPNTPFNIPNLPFHHAAVLLPEVESKSRAKALERTYENLVDAAFLPLGVSRTVWARADPTASSMSPDIPSSNFIMTRQWMLLIPRRMESVEGISINSVGYAGMLLTKTEADIEKLVKLGPMKVLTELAYPGNATSSSSRGSFDSQTRLILGRYKSIRVLGEGSFAKVKLAEDVYSGEQVAIKCFEKSRLGKASALVLPMRLSYVVVYAGQVGETHDHVYLVMEHVDGGELFDFIVASGRLKETQARRFFRQCVSALEYCHMSCLVHRDLKPENMLVDSRGQVKIVDFGFVNTFHPDEHLNTFCGSLLYAAPEMIGKSEYRGSTVDVWSLGIVLYALLTGNLPFNERTPQDMYRLITTARYEVPEFLSDDAKHLLSRMLTVDPAKRANITEIRTHPWVTGTEGQLSTAVPPRPPLTNLDENILIRMKALGFDGGSPEVRKLLITDPRSPEFAVYYLLLEHDQFLRDKKDRRSIPSSTLMTTDTLPKGASVAADAVDEEEENDDAEGLPCQFISSARPSTVHTVLSLEDVNDDNAPQEVERRPSRIMSRRVSGPSVGLGEVLHGTPVVPSPRMSNAEHTPLSKLDDAAAKLRDEVEVRIRDATLAVSKSTNRSSTHRRNVTAPPVAELIEPVSSARRAHPVTSSHGRRATLSSLDAASLPKTTSNFSGLALTTTSPKPASPNSAATKGPTVSGGRRHSIQVVGRELLPNSTSEVTKALLAPTSSPNPSASPSSRRPLLSASLTTTLPPHLVHAELVRTLRATGIRAKSEGALDSGQFKCSWENAPGDVGPGGERGGEVEFEVVTRNVEGTSMRAV